MYEDILYTLQMPNCPFFYKETLPLLFFLIGALPYPSLLFLKKNFLWASSFQREFGTYCGHCPWTMVSLMGLLFLRPWSSEAHRRTSTCRAVFAGDVCWLGWAGSAGRAQELCTSSAAHTEALPSQQGRNQPGNGFPTGFEALNWETPPCWQSFSVGLHAFRLWLAAQRFAVVATAFPSY